MLAAYKTAERGLARCGEETPLASAIWIDLLRPEPAEIEAVGALGRAVPTLADMEEIEISSRLYREGDADYMTVVLPGRRADGADAYGPVSFILTSDQLLTVRHHAPRPFETFAERADRTMAGSRTAERVFLGLIEEIVARLADLLESIGKTMDRLAADVFTGDAARDPHRLREVLRELGRQGEMLARVRIGLLTIERALSFFEQTLGADETKMHGILAALLRDIAALGVHADFLSTRISQTNDATLGLINLEQNATVRIVSVVAVLFLPPTLVASIYGMNFRHMPELAWPWGYPLAIAIMVGAAALTYAFFKWRRWL